MQVGPISTTWWCCLLAGDATVVLHHGLVERDKGFGDGRAALHGQRTIGREAARFVEKRGQFGNFGVMVEWQ